MKAFLDATSAWEYYLHLCRWFGAKQETRQKDRGFTLELLEEGFVLHDPTRCFNWNSVRKHDMKYWAVELAWTLGKRLSGNTFLLNHYPKYKQYLEPDGIAYWAYGPRIMDKVEKCIELLLKHPDSRRATVSFQAEDDLQHAVDEDVKDIPCFTEMQFIIRDGALNMRVQMRSQDVWVGMPCDIALMCTLQMLVAARLGVGIGCYIHRFTSVHLYDKHLSVADDALDAVGKVGVDAPERFKLAPQTLQSANGFMENCLKTDPNPSGVIELLTRKL